MTQAQDDIEDELRIELMTMRAENFRTQVLREPWKAMAWRRRLVRD